jgi:hypothetical protein
MLILMLYSRGLFSTARDPEKPTKAYFPVQLSHVSIRNYFLIHIMDIHKDKIKVALGKPRLGLLSLSDVYHS